MQTKNFHMSKLGLEKEEEPDQIAKICWIIEKTREFQKNIYLWVSSIMPKSLAVGIIIKCGKFLKRWEHQTILPVS